MGKVLVLLGYTKLDQKIKRVALAGVYRQEGAVKWSQIHLLKK